MIQRLLLALVLLPLASACGTDPSPSANTTVPVPKPVSGPVAGEHVWTTPDGNTIPYTVAGKHDATVTVVLVHCWMCDGTFWDAQLPALAADYRTVTLDLPGHGQASAERTAWTVNGYGEDVAGLVRALALDAVVLVGHSMGGPVSLRAAALLPDAVRGVVAVDALHNADFKFEGPQIDGFMQAFEDDFVGTCTNFVNQMFVEDDVEQIAEAVRQAGCHESRATVGAALMRSFGAIDMPAWFRGAGVPIRAINASAPNPTNVEGNRQYADFDVTVVDNVGHYLHMTRPDTFNPLLLDAVADVVDVTNAGL